MKKILIAGLVLALFAFTGCAIQGADMTTSQADASLDYIEDGIEEAIKSSNSANARAINLTEEGLSADFSHDETYANADGTVIIGIDVKGSAGVSTSGPSADTAGKLVFKFNNFKFISNGYQVTLKGRYKIEYEAAASAGTTTEAGIAVSMGPAFPSLKVTAVDESGTTRIDDFVAGTLEASGNLGVFSLDLQFKGTFNNATIDESFEIDWSSLIPAIPTL